MELIWKMYANVWVGTTTVCFFSIGSKQISSGPSQPTVNCNRSLSVAFHCFREIPPTHKMVRRVIDRPFPPFQEIAVHETIATFWYVMTVLPRMRISQSDQHAASCSLRALNWNHSTPLTILCKHKVSSAVPLYCEYCQEWFYIVSGWISGPSKHLEKLSTVCFFKPIC